MECYLWLKWCRLWWRNENTTSIKFETKNIKSSLCDYSDVYILVTADTTATDDDTNTNVPFKNFAPFTRYVTDINDKHKHIDTAENLHITVPMYDWIWW